MEGLLKVLGFVFFIFVGYFLKRTHILKEDTVHALSGLLLYVTLPCLILVCLNGLHIEASYFWLIGLGLATNFFMIGIAYLITRKHPENRLFDMLNLSGFNVGTFVMPFLQTFVTPTGFLSICLFDIGNSIMCTGTTYAIASGTGTGLFLLCHADFGLCRLHLSSHGRRLGKDRRQRQCFFSDDIARAKHPFRHAP